MLRRMLWQECNLHLADSLLSLAGSLGFQPIPSRQPMAATCKLFYMQKQIHIEISWGLSTPETFPPLPPSQGKGLPWLAPEVLLHLLHHGGAGHHRPPRHPGDSEFESPRTAPNRRAPARARSGMCAWRGVVGFLAASRAKKEKKKERTNRVLIKTNSKTCSSRTNKRRKRASEERSKELPLLFTPLVWL